MLLPLLLLLQLLLLLDVPIWMHVRQFCSDCFLMLWPSTFYLDSKLVRHALADLRNRAVWSRMRQLEVWFRLSRLIAKPT